MGVESRDVKGYLVVESDMSQREGIHAYETWAAVTMPLPLSRLASTSMFLWLPFLAVLF